MADLVQRVGGGPPHGHPVQQTAPGWRRVDDGLGLVGLNLGDPCPLKWLHRWCVGCAAGWNAMEHLTG